MTKRPCFSAELLESICQYIADTTDGLTGAEIGRILQQVDIKDIDPNNTKWRRLFNAFVEWQNQHQCSNHILRFIQFAISPVRYIGKSELFNERRVEINKRLLFIGIEMQENGKFALVNKVTTVKEAEDRSNRLKDKLRNRGTHPEVFKYCNAELLVDNYFHASFEAVKSIAQRIRDMASVEKDGNELIDLAFSTRSPIIKINQLQTDTERSEHIGLSNFIKGLFGMIRNPTAHEPKVKFEITEAEAIDYLTMVSYAHKRLDNRII